MTLPPAEHLPAKSAIGTWRSIGAAIGALGIVSVGLALGLIDAGTPPAVSADAVPAAASGDPAIKFAQRLHPSIEAITAGPAVVTPAALAMPLALGWERAEPIAIATQVTSPPTMARARTARVQRPDLPPARPRDVEISLRRPSQQQAAIQFAALEATEAQESAALRPAAAGLSRPVAAARQFAWQTAEAVGAAGASTLSAAASLIPRWP